MMKNKNGIVVLSRSRAKLFSSNSPWAVVSISDPYDEKPKLNLAGCVDALYLNFWDNDSIDDLPESEDENFFAPKHALQVWDFVDKVWDKIDVLMVHCLAGSCRSPAVAAAVSKVKWDDDGYFFKTFTPNMHVYGELIRAAYKLGKIS